MGARSFRFWMARVLAPIAFFAAAALLVLVIRDAFDDDEAAPGIEIAVTDESGETVVVTTTFTPTEPVPEAEPPPASPSPASPSPGETTDKPIPRTYRVKAGDTLESIAAQFGVDLDALRELNPKVDPVALQKGQRIRLR